ncbi:MAG: HigA family addiction module antidote protein [Rhodospirillales bacterium]|jgi:addiction module HigA family antidote|nr:HigA family addiction module antidote protein [Rhodospirillales bacterium]MBT3905190.1 HigA family addiction module antidote protein [Rhodospirillaceae bacterium]MBT5035784.1 HigA family addiction module antidote protein [Rhodospirillaceae bacterium]MBT6218787.1 HigA family addiction module antidote protein [Rhodospirillaceae bacterium]MBT6364377.1 HigA family addiction module antidote protein [Rhodospirillaceae bacterium]
MTRIHTHPGEILGDELEALGMSKNALAKALGTDASRIGEIVAKRRGVSADMAIRLAEYFDGAPDFWLTMQARHDLSVIETSKGSKIRRQVRKPDVAA